MIWMLLDRIVLLMLLLPTQQLGMIIETLVVGLPLRCVLCKETTSWTNQWIKRSQAYAGLSVMSLTELWWIYHLSVWRHIIPLLLDTGGAGRTNFSRYSVLRPATSYWYFCPVFSNDSLNFLVPQFLFWYYFCTEFATLKWSVSFLKSLDFCSTTQASTREALNSLFGPTPIGTHIHVSAVETKKIRPTRN